MTIAAVISSLAIPADARVDQRVPKKLLVENGAPTTADKRQINEGIEELFWLATLKPATIGVPTFADDTREYLEIAVLTLVLRAEAKASRITELIHRAIPYPVLLIQSLSSGIALSLARLRWSQGQSGETVLDGSLLTATVDFDTPATKEFLASLNVTSQPRQNLQAFYQGWVERFEAFAAARITGSFKPATDAGAAERRRTALAEHERLTREIVNLRSRAEKESQLSRRVDLNLQVKQLETRLAETTNHF